MDEKIIQAIPNHPDGSPASSGLVRLSPRGHSALYIDPANPTNEDVPAELVVVQLASIGRGSQRSEVRVDHGRASYRELSSFLRVGRFAPDGSVFVSPDFRTPEPSGGTKRRPLLVCQLATGKVAKTEFQVDLRYAAIDNTSTMLLDMDGPSYSLATGQRGRRFGYMGLVEGVNPVAPLVSVNMGTEHSQGPPVVVVWNVRDNKLFARVPHNEKFKSAAYVETAWTSDGTYLYFGDAVGDHFRSGSFREAGIEMVTRVWNIKTGQIVGQPLPWTRWRRPGPRPGTMILSTANTLDAEPRQFLHDAESGATVDLPVEVLDVGGAAVAYVKPIEKQGHLCVATLRWGAAPADADANRTLRPAASKRSRQTR